MRVAAQPGLDAQELAQLRATDEPFLRWQLEMFLLDTVVCNGRSVFDSVQKLTNARLVESGKLARITWYVAVAEMRGRAMGVVGWNIPLARPTGLDREGHEELGRLLSRRQAKETKGEPNNAEIPVHL